MNLGLCSWSEADGSHGSLWTHIRPRLRRMAFPRVWHGTICRHITRSTRNPCMIQKLAEAFSSAVNVTFQPTQKLWILLIVVLVTGFSLSTACAQQGKTLAESRAVPYPQLSENVERRAVTIWSDGTKMAGDVYRPKNLKPDDKLPAFVFVHGTGGVKKAGFSVRLATACAQSGYVFLNFDYRGWGESESKLLMLGEMSEPDEKGELTVKVRAIRWQMDFQDQTTDIRSAIAFMSGEPS